jgi:hypothetical protein
LNPNGNLAWNRFLVSLCLLALICCGRAGSAPNPLGRRLLDRTPAGYQRVGSPATGPMTIDQASTSTEAAQSRLRRQLETTGFQSGFARVYERKDDFIVLLAYDFLSARRANDLVTFVSSEMANYQSAIPFSVPSMKGARGLILNARNARGVSLFCQIVWFARGTDAFSVRMCAVGPNSTGDVTALAREESDWAGRHPA